MDTMIMSLLAHPTSPLSQAYQWKSWEGYHILRDSQGVPESWVAEYRLLTIRCQLRHHPIYADTGIGLFHQLSNWPVWVLIKVTKIGSQAGV